MPTAAATPIRRSTPQCQRLRARKAKTANSSAKASSWPAGRSTGWAKNRAKLTITPTTAAVIAVSGAPRRRSSRLASTRGPPQRMKPKLGKKVNHTTTNEASTAPSHWPGDPSTP